MNCSYHRTASFLARVEKIRVVLRILRRRIEKNMVDVLLEN